MRPLGIFLPSTGKSNRQCCTAYNKFFVAGYCPCRPPREQTSQPGCVFGFFSCAKSTHSSAALKDGVGRTDTFETKQTGTITGQGSKILNYAGAFAPPSSPVSFEPKSELAVIKNLKRRIRINLLSLG